MYARRILVICVFASLLAIVLMLGMETVNPASAQGPTSTDPSNSEQPGSPSAPGQIEQEPMRPQAPNATTYYYHIRGADFYSADTSVQTSYATYGCEYRTAGSTGLNFPVIVPPGSVLKGIRVYYLDNSPSDLNVYLVQYDDGIGSTTLVSFTSSGTSASVRVTDSAVITHTVDYYNLGLSLESATC